MPGPGSLLVEVIGALVIQSNLGYKVPQLKMMSSEVEKIKVRMIFGPKDQFF